MSVVFKCDRCGEIFNRKVPDINDCYGTANSILFLDCTVERNRFGLGEEPVQLCPSCMKELNDWLEPNKEILDNGNKNEWNNMTTQPQCNVAVEIKLENGDLDIAYRRYNDKRWFQSSGEWVSSDAKIVAWRYIDWKENRSEQSSFYLSCDYNSGAVTHTVIYILWFNIC